MEQKAPWRNAKTALLYVYIIVHFLDAGEAVYLTRNIGLCNHPSFLILDCRLQHFRKLGSPIEVACSTTSLHIQRLLSNVRHCYNNVMYLVLLRSMTMWVLLFFEVSALDSLGKKSALFCFLVVAWFFFLLLLRYYR